MIFPIPNQSLIQYLIEKQNPNRISVLASLEALHSTMEPFWGKKLARSDIFEAGILHSFLTWLNCRVAILLFLTSKDIL